MKGKFSKILGKDGFYIILFICVCIVAITAVWVSKSNLDKMNSGKSPIQDEDFLEVKEENEEEPSLEIAKMERKRIDDEEEEEEPEEEPKEEPPKNEEKKVPTTETIETFYTPVDGKKGLDFTDENLIYSNTLEEWTSHEGIDINATEGSVVKACLNGVVKEVYEDDLWGIVIVLDHGNGLETKYANLSTKDMVQVGQQVQKGQVISKIGKPKGLEMADGPHLHFEVILNEKNVDPKKYLSNLN